MTVAINTELAELAEDVFGRRRPRAPGSTPPLWATLEDTGLARLTLPADVGGSEASFADAAVVLNAAGAHAARVPLVETDLLAGWLLQAAEIPLPDGPAHPGRRGPGRRPHRPPGRGRPAPGAVGALGRRDRRARR